MTSYLREAYRPDGLPALHNRSGLLTEPTIRRPLTTFDDVLAPSYGPQRPGSPLPYRPLSPTQTRRSLFELQDQLKVYKDEMRKKDELIQQLARYDAISAGTGSRYSAPKPVEQSWLESKYDRHAVETARSEAAALQAKIDRLQQQIRESQTDNDGKDVRIKELETSSEMMRENEVRLTTLVSSLRERMTDLETHAGTFETVAGRSEFAISTLQKEKRELQDRIAELETRLRKLLQEREDAEQKSQTWEKKFTDVVGQFSSILRADEVTDFLAASTEHLTSKLSEIVQENALLKGKLLTLQEMLANTEVETKASRETIMRLVSEVGREQKTSTLYSTDMDALRNEHDNAVISNREMEREMELLRERLVSNQRALDAARNELSDKDTRLSTLNREVRHFDHDVHSTKTHYTLFKEQLASMLSDSYHRVDASDEAICQRIATINETSKEKDNHIDLMEEKICKLTEQLESNYDHHHNASQRVHKYETELLDMRERLRGYEGELATGGILKDNFKIDKERYLHFLQRLSEVLKMDRINLDLGLDMTIDALLARAEQLMKLESDAVADRSTHVYNLQRKVKSLKEQLESKDLHMELLRKKITGLEERVHGRVELERDRDSESIRVKKLEKVVEKHKVQLNDARHEIMNLKAQLLGSSELKVHTLEQRKEIEELIKQVDEIEHIRQRQAKKIAGLKNEVEYQEHENEEKRSISSNAVTSLSSELRTTKAALDAVQSREKQLVDFRTVVARMLGLDVNTLAVPDYEVITRLEKLIQAHHGQTFSTMNLEDALADMEDGFVKGYESAHKSAIRADESLRKSRGRARARAARARARSMSPVRRDPRSY